MTSSGGINTVLYYLVFCVVYVISVTFSGCFRAWLASVWGDTTARDQGFASLDVAQHVDLFGLMCIVMMGFGWGVYVPVVLENIRGRAAGLKRVLVLYSETLMHVCIVALFYYTSIPGVASQMVSPICGIFDFISDSCPSVSNLFDLSMLGISGHSYWQALGWFRMGFFSINPMLASITFIINSVHIIVKDVFATRESSWTDHIFIWLLTLMLIVFLHEWVSMGLIMLLNGVYSAVWLFIQAVQGIYG